MRFVPAAVHKSLRLGYHFERLHSPPFAGPSLLSILVLACWITEQWIERQGHRILDRMTWHEPVESWNQ